MLGFWGVTASASSAARPATNVGRSHTEHARFERVSSFRASPAVGSGPSRYFSADASLQTDLPKDQMSRPASAAVPKVTGTKTNGSSQATSAFGLNAADLSRSHGFVVEPPDQGLCAGNGSVVELVNFNIQVYSESTFARVGPLVNLETFFGQPFAFGVTPGTDFTIQGDPKCYYDAATQRWFLTQLDIDFTNNTSRIFIAVSQTSDPTGSYNIYSIDNTDPGNPGCPCLGDQPLLGANQDAIFLSTNEFSINNPNFNGAIVYAVDKSALVSGASGPNVFVDPIGLNTPTPDGSCYDSKGNNTGICWYSIQPAETASGTSSVRNSGGVEYALSALDFFNQGDNRVAVWAFSNTNSIHSTPAIQVTETQVLTTARYIFPGIFGRQAPGTLPLQKCVETSGCSLFAKPTKVPEGQIQSNDDRMNQVVYANGILWSGVNTAVKVNGTNQVGIAYFGVKPRFAGSSLSGSSIIQQGYLAPSGADVLFPSIGVTSGGNGIMTFTITGPNNFPSVAYTTMSAAAGAGPVTVALAGASPDDSFSEYQGFGTPAFRPRWGDYSAAVVDGSAVVFAAEMIQFANCDWATFHLDPTCGGTRDEFANWGTGLGRITP
jgi:hypothetical protein